MASINASALRIIEMKLHYNILTRSQAQQLLAHNGALSDSQGGDQGRGTGPYLIGITALANIQVIRDADVRRQGVFPENVGCIALTP